MSNRLTIALACALLFGCADSTVELSEFDEELANAICATTYHCGFVEGRDTLRAIFPTESACRETTTSALGADPALQALADSVEAGTMTYDGERARACLIEARERCVPAYLIWTMCRDAFVGTAEIGAPCVRTPDCAPGAWCVLTTSCDGVCRATRELGASCNATDECAPVADGWVECREGRCVDTVVGEAAAIDEPCGFESTETGTLWTPCEPDSFCTGLVDGFCRLPLAVGAACRDGSELCVDSMCAAHFLGANCRAQTRRDVGEPCGVESIFDACAFGLRCEAGTCRTVERQPAGEPCTFRLLVSEVDEYLEVNDQCEPGLSCVDGFCLGAIACEPEE